MDEQEYLDNQQLLAGANRKANLQNTLAAVAAMSNNPGAAAATKMAAADAQRQYSPKALGNQGYMMPETGAFVPSKIYVDEKNAAREEKRSALAATLEAKLERQDRDLAYRVDRDADRNDQKERDRALRSTLAAMRGGGDKPAKPTFKETDVVKLREASSKAQLGRLMSQGRQLADQLGDDDSVDMPGFSVKEQNLQKLPFGKNYLDPKAIDNMTAVQGIYNAFTRADAGLSQTVGEVQRQALETFNGATTPARVRKQVFRDHILPLIEQSRGQILGQAPPDALKEYRNRQEGVGGDTAWMDPLNIPKSKRQASGGITPQALSAAEQAEMAALRKQLGR